MFYLGIYLTYSIGGGYELLNCDVIIKSSLVYSQTSRVKDKDDRLFKCKDSKLQCRLSQLPLNATQRTFEPNEVDGGASD